MAITTFSDAPTAGTTVTLTCTVISDLPSLITWSGPSGSILTNSSDFTITQDIILDSVLENYDPTANVSIGTPRSNRVNAVLRGVSNLTFHPLRASDGDVYTCNSIVNATSVRRNASQAYSLNVQRKLISVI